MLHTDIDQFSDMQFVQLTGERLQGKHRAPCIAVGIRQHTISHFECLDGPVQPLQFVDCCLELGVRHSSPFAVSVRVCRPNLKTDPSRGPMLVTGPRG
jgi:hypothetical protein